MPGEATIAAAAASWTGPEAVVFGGLVVAVVIMGALLWKHQSKCEAAQARVHERMDELAKELSEVRANVARIEERTRPT